MLGQSAKRGSLFERKHSDPDKCSTQKVLHRKEKERREIMLLSTQTSANTLQPLYVSVLVMQTEEDMYTLFC